MELNFHISVLILIINSLIIMAKSDVCDVCIKTEQCVLYEKMNMEQRKNWSQKFSCNPSNQEYSSLFGFAPIAKEDYICCSDDIWNTADHSYSNPRPLIRQDYTDNQNSYSKNQNEGYTPNKYDNENYYENNNSQNMNQRPALYNKNNGTGNHEFDENNYNTGYFNENPGRNTGFDAEKSEHDKIDYEPSRVSNVEQIDRNLGSNFPDLNSNPYFNGRRENPYFSDVNNANNNNPLNRMNPSGQCTVLTSFPPDPKTGCCGREASDSDRIVGGRETELDQYPWTVLLEITFTKNFKDSTYTCGGTLISSRYVLTASHCLYEEGSTLTNLGIYLSEYDKRTFPQDCKISVGTGKICIDNLRMYAERIIIHPQFEGEQLHNDIALIRLRGNAPYTDFIRPVCLPTFDIDNPDYYNLPLAVSGWGRNGPYKSDIKQATVVNLVPRQRCQTPYPGLTRSHLCAAGYTGEDTCKGDSGGPLMLLDGGNYFVVGVVSGKRADVPCGTSVPSLYTNVFHFLDWIRSNIQN